MKSPVESSRLADPCALTPHRPPRILLVGRYPPPYGGVTVHIQRLQRTLLADCEAVVLDVYPSPEKQSGQPAGDSGAFVVRGNSGSTVGALLAYIRLLAGRRFDIVHFHTAAMKRFTRVGLPLLLLARLFGARAVLTVHSGGLAARHSGVGARFMLRGLLALCHRVVAVNPEQQDYLVGTIGLDSRRLSVIPAFLPPRVAKTSRWADQLTEWHTAGFRILCSSGSGLPHYGFHTLLDALRRLAAELPCALVLALGGDCDEEYLQRLRASAGAVPLVIGRDLAPEELAWVLRHCDLYLRCSDRDGDAVAIREAMYLGTPVIASDCVGRPSGVETFVTNDAADLARAIVAVSCSGDRRETSPTPDYAAQLRTVYGLDPVEARVGRRLTRPAG